MPRQRLRSWLLLAAMAAVAACQGSMGTGPRPDGDGDVDSDSDGDGDSTGCVDLDGDGYGRNCDQGADCDDADPVRHDNCEVVRMGGDDGTPFRPGEDNSSGVLVDEDGDLTLQGHPAIEPAVWIANAGEGTVSRLDALTGREIARYPSVITGSNGGRPWNEQCNYESQGNCPSRTAIDFRGDCWVANRAFGNQGTATKIASHIEDCIDRSGDGVIQTSQDLNDDGVITLAGGEFVGDADECVLFTVDVGGPNGVPRALAVAPDASGISSGGNAWVGLNSERQAAEIDGDSGEIRRYVTLPLNPYGALASKYEGKVWFTNAGWQSGLPNNPPGIAAVDFRTAEVSPRYNVQSTNDCVGTYGIAIDPEGRVWVGGYPCHGAFRYDPSAGNWLTVRVPDSGTARGLVADADGWIWVAHSSCPSGNCGLVTRFRADDGSNIQYYHLPTGDDTIGVDLDVDGRVWVVSRASNNAARIDPETGSIEEFPVGFGPYTYSDFTGHSLLLQFPRGYYRDVVEACAGAHWNAVRWDADTPPDTTVEVRVRAADTRIGLAAAPWIGPWLESPGDLQAEPGPVPNGSFLEFEMTLVTLNELAVPVVHSIEFGYECPVS